MAKYYEERSYLSAIEAAKYLGIDVKTLHKLTKEGIIPAKIAPSGQRRFDLKKLKEIKDKLPVSHEGKQINIDTINIVEVNGTIQKVIVKNSMKMDELADESIHLVITSPPYFNTKMYSAEPIEGDLGNIHNIDEWFEKISEVWKLLAAADLQRNGIGYEINPEIAFIAVRKLKMQQEKHPQP